MAKVYGKRWKIIGNLGEGGQSDVFQVSDLHGEFKDPVALKRIRNPRRRDRFRNEIEAIKRLNHPSVIKLLDHSAMESTSDSDDKQYLVMPIAASGDLSKCVQRFASNLDGTRIAAFQLASALAEAHQQGVIHRDVKPQNVLFPGTGNDLWLTDFGICLLSDGLRGTLDEEVVGPWSFIAPELEGGGQLIVTPAADVYSLGKLIYYMLSGGLILPRERLGEPQYAQVFKEGGRFNLIRLLLEKMICPVDRRITDMKPVLFALNEIRDYDSRSIIAPLTAKASSKIEQLRAKHLEEQRITHANRMTRDEQSDRELRVRGYVGDWLGTELDKLAVVIGAGGVFGTTVTSTQGERCYLPPYLSHGRVDLCVSDGSEQFPSTHVLEMHICHSSDGMVTVRSGHQPITEYEPVDRLLIVIPLYRRDMGGVRTALNQRPPRFYIGPDSELIPVPGPVLPSHMPTRGGGMRQPAQPAPRPQGVAFLVSDWPEADGRLRAFLTSTCDSFIDIIDRKRGRY